MLAPFAESVSEAVLVERSQFRPPTKLTLQMLECAQRQLCAERAATADDVVVLSEMTLHNLMDKGDIDPEDFLHRAEILGALGKQVLIRRGRLQMMMECDSVTGFVYQVPFMWLPPGELLSNMVVF